MLGNGYQHQDCTFLDREISTDFLIAYNSVAAQITLVATLLFAVMECKKGTKYGCWNLCIHVCDVLRKVQEKSTLHLLTAANKCVAPEDMQANSCKVSVTEDKAETPNGHTITQLAEKRNISCSGTAEMLSERGAGISSH